MSRSSRKSTTLVIRQEDLPPIRKKQAPPAKPMRDRTAYRRKGKHVKRDDATCYEHAPGWEIQPGVLRLFGILSIRPQHEALPETILSLALAAALGR